jgi:putative FmdB family regulatory protein
MPTYDYSCKTCGATKIITSPITEALEAQLCAKCKQEMIRLYNIGAVTFKGSGFYVNE